MKIHLTSFFISFVIDFTSGYLPDCEDGWRLVGSQCFIWVKENRKGLDAKSYCENLPGKVSLAQPDDIWALHLHMKEKGELVGNLKYAWYVGAEIANPGVMTWLSRGLNIPAKYQDNPDAGTDGCIVLTWTDMDTPFLRSISCTIGRWHICGKDAGKIGISLNQLCPHGFFNIKSRCLKILKDTSVTGDEAQSKCESEGYMLATHTDKIAVELRRYLLDNYGEGSFVWLGARGTTHSMSWYKNSGVISDYPSTVGRTNPLWISPWSYASYFSHCLFLFVWEEALRSRPVSPYGAWPCLPPGKHYPPVYTLCEPKGIGYLSRPSNVRISYIPFTTVMVAWDYDDSLGNVSYYNIYYNYKNISVIDKKQTNIMDLEPSTKYILHVVAVDKSGHETPSDPTYFVTSRPTYNVKMSSINDTTVRVAWEDNHSIGQISYYNIKYGRFSKHPSCILYRDISVIDEKQTIITGLEPATRYILHVAAVDKSGHEIFSDSDPTFFVTNCPPPFFNINSRCLKIFKDYGVTRAEAKNRCESERLLMPTHTDVIAVELRKYLLDNYGDASYVWLGASGDGAEIRWHPTQSNGYSSSTVARTNPLWVSERKENYTSASCLLLIVREGALIHRPYSPYETWSCSPPDNYHPVYTLCEVPHPHIISCIPPRSRCSTCLYGFAWNSDLMQAIVNFALRTATDAKKSDMSVNSPHW